MPKSKTSPSPKQLSTIHGYYTRRLYEDENWNKGRNGGKVTFDEIEDQISRMKSLYSKKLYNLRKYSDL